MQLLERKIRCPYCGEVIDVLIDDSVIESDYYEDCSVCCRAIRIQSHIAVDGDCQLVILREDD